MNYMHYLQRVFTDRKKVIIIVFLILLPCVDLCQILYEHYALGFEKPFPAYANFLALYTVGTNHLIHKIMFWFLPLYLLVICSEDSIEDGDTGYRYMLINRLGRKKYLLGALRNSFFLGFSVIAISLLLNLVLCELFFSGGSVISLAPPDETDPKLYVVSYMHPYITNIVYVLITAFIGGLLSCVGTSLGISIGDRRIVYGITFMLWFVLVVMKYSVMLVIQPYMEYGLNIVGTVFMLMVLGDGIVIIGVTAVEMKNEQG